jgi:ABC-2 type transport system ATP-binding protein
MLKVENLHKRFGDVHAVNGLTLEVKRGEVFGFLGPNGAGKTTAMRIITGFMPASDGHAYIAGCDTLEHHITTRSRIGYLPESNPLYPEMRVNEYLSFVGEIRGLEKERLEKRLGEVTGICGLKEVYHKQIGKLSKGYRQRVGLAQAIIHDPELLILDEPMSGLDPNQIIEIRNLIKRLGTEKTVIYCSHILSEVAATCSRIVIINKGAIVASGTPQELTEQGGGNRYDLSVKADKETAQQKLSEIEGVSQVIVHDGEDGWLEVEVAATAQEDVREKIFQCVVGNGWSMSELKKRSASLEDIFTQLTKG